MKWPRHRYRAILVAAPLAVVAAWACHQDTRLFVAATLNGVTLAALYFLVASGFALIFGLMRNVNLAHGSLYLLGAYVGYTVGDLTGSWYLGVVAGALGAAVLGVVLQVSVFRFMPGQELRQALVTVAISVASYAVAVVLRLVISSTGTANWIPLSYNYHAFLLAIHPFTFVNWLAVLLAVALMLSCCLDLKGLLVRKFAALAALFALPAILFGYVEDLRVWLPCAVMLCFAVAASRAADKEA